jgi:hypothetical protein
MRDREASNAIVSIAFSREGHRFVAAYADGSTHVWAYDSDYSWRMRQTTLHEHNRDWFSARDDLDVLNQTELTYEAQEVANCLMVPNHLAGLTMVAALRICEDRVPLGEILQRRYRAAIMTADWNRAEQDIGEALAMSDEGKKAIGSRLYRDWALLLLQKARVRKEFKSGTQDQCDTDDFAGYEMVCKEIARRFPEPSTGTEACALARVRTLIPVALTNTEKTDLSRIAKMAFEASPGDPDCCEVYGAALYRCGAYREAVTALRNAVSRSDGLANYWQQCFLAMAYHRLGLDKEAQLWLDRAGKSKEVEQDEVWQSSVQRHFLRWEAAATLKGRRAQANDGKSK